MSVCSCTSATTLDSQDESLIRFVQQSHLQHALENWNNFLILPLFAFFNTGIAIAGAAFSLRHPEVLGTILGLTVGKPLGIMTFVGLSTWLGVARKSAEISWLQMVGAACLCGIGFTMSIFIASAAFEGDHLLSVKLAVLLASVCSAILGVGFLMRASAMPPSRK